ncbi:MAG: hypothetical protein ACI94Y_002519 [Maribacter sp.]|jgi:hypothetical protein
MNTDKPLVNRVASSGLLTINLEEFYPEGEVMEFDLKDYLFMELILKEKDFREALKAHDWQQYEGKHLLLFCSVDAIIPMWAYMLVSAHAEPFTASITQGNKEEFLKLSYQTVLSNIDFNQYEDKRVVIKGCSDKPVPAFAYSFLTQKLRAKAKSIMFGEPCSTVPVYKKPRLPKK